MEGLLIAIYSIQIFPTFAPFLSPRKVEEIQQFLEGFCTLYDPIEIRTMFVTEETHSFFADLSIFNLGSFLTVFRPILSTIYNVRYTHLYEKCIVLLLR